MSQLRQAAASFTTTQVEPVHELGADAWAPTDPEPEMPGIPQVVATPPHLDGLASEVSALLTAASQTLLDRHREVLRAVERLCVEGAVGSTSATRFLEGRSEPERSSEKRKAAGNFRDNVHLGADNEGAVWQKNAKLRESHGAGRSSWGVSKKSAHSDALKCETVRPEQAKSRGSLASLTKLAEEEKKLQKIAVFANVDDLKTQVKHSVMKKTYSVVDYYYEEGVLQQIVKHPLFDTATLLVILMNAIWIAVDTDSSASVSLFSAPLYIVVIENLFCLYFSMEITLRFMAFKTKRQCWRDPWFVFDTVLVVMMVLETWVLSIILHLVQVDTSQKFGDMSIFRLIRILRLTRMARIAHLLAATPELMILIKGICVAARSVFFTLVLLFLIIYVFSVGFVQLTDDESWLRDRYFDNVPEAMSTLLLRAALPDIAPIVEDVGKQSYLLAGVMLVFILLSSLTLLNMLVGVLCEVVSVVAAVESEKMQLQFVHSKVLELVKHGDTDGNESISREEFEHLLLIPEGAQILQEVGVDAVGLIDFSDHIFEKGEEISFEDFMEVILQLRGTNTASVRDIVDLRKYIAENTLGILNKVDNMKDTVNTGVAEHVEQVVPVRRSSKESDSSIN